MGWKDELPESVREWDEVKNAETPEAFFDQMANLRSTVGQSIRIPGEDADEATRVAFDQKLIEKVPGLIRVPGEDDEEGFNKLYQRLGAPETAEGYEFDKDDPLVDVLKETALKSKLTKKQFKEVTERLLELNATSASTAAETHDRAIGDLKLKWGQAYDEKVALAELVRKQYFPFAPEGEAIGAQTIEAFVKLGEQMGSESQKLTDTGGQSKGTLTPGEAKLQISEMMSNKDHPYWNRRDPAHKAAREKMSRLNHLAYPN